MPKKTNKPSEISASAHQQPHTKISVQLMKEPPSNRAYDMRDLLPAADRIADSVSSVATAVKKSRWLSRLDHAKPLIIFISVTVGGAFGLEQYLASRHEATIVSMDRLFSSTSSALGTSDQVLQANAVRTLPRIGQFSTYTMPHELAPLGLHLYAQIFSLRSQYYYFEQSWLLFRDFATSRREQSGSLVSSAILNAGARWEHQIRSGEEIPIGWIGGSLLFQARLPGARAIKIDLQGIQFGASDLVGANLSGSNCSNCGLLGVHLDDAVLRETNFDSAFLAEARMNGADFSFAKLTRSVLQKASATNAKFLQTDLTNTDFTGARLDSSLFNQAILFKTDFTNSSLRGVRFLQCDVSSAMFNNADVESADFSHAFGFSEQLLRTARNPKKAIVPKLSHQKEIRK